MNLIRTNLLLWAFLIFGALAANNAFGQPVQQSGSVTPNTSPIWSSTGIIKGGNTATDSPLTTFGVTRDAADALCVSSARSTAAGRNQLCLQAATSGPAKISLQNYGTATAQALQFSLNGVTLTLPSGGGTFVTGTGAFIAGHAACWNSTTGILQDCGVSVAAGTQFGVPYYSTTSNLTSTGAATSGQLLLGQNAAAPLWTNLSGDVSSLSAGGALTLSKVNGIPFSTTYTAHGVLLGEGSSAFSSLATASVGQCLLSQGSSADPIWSSCAAGAGSAGGSNTQVQFNNSTSLGGSVNFTWVSPALTLGVAGTTTGQLALAPAAGVSGTVTVQNPSATSAYNFNLPTGAGSLGQPMLSGGGGSTAMTFGTLGVAGGGTGASSASGTALDNITGFGSTGFIQRTGAGTYAFSTVITVSGGGTGLANGTSGGIPAYTGASTMTSSALLTQYALIAGGGAGAVPATVTKGTAGQILIDQTAANPSWNTLSGDATINSAGALTIANSAVTVGKMANAAAYSLMGNFTGSAAAPQLSTIGSLTQKASPAAGDYVILQDNSASGQLKYATVSSVSSAGSVASFNGLTGAVSYVTPPQGRLTLTTNTPVMITTVASATQLKYDCYNGNQVPYYNGAADLFDTIASCEVADNLVSAASAGQIVNGQVYDVWWVTGGANKICVAMSASGGGGGGWASDTAGSSTARGTGYSQLDNITRPYTTNKNSITNCFNGATNYGPVSANQGTYLGTILATANGQTAWIFGAAAGNGTAGVFGVWNMYNRVSVSSTSSDTTDTWTYAGSGTVRAANASNTMRTTYVIGVREDDVFAQYVAMAAAGASGQAGVGICLNATNAYSGVQQVTNVPTALTPLSGSYNALVGAGLQFVQACEITSSGVNQNFYGDNGGSVFQTGMLTKLRM